MPERNCIPIPSNIKLSQHKEMKGNLVSGKGGLTRRARNVEQEMTGKLVSGKSALIRRARNVEQEANIIS
jgi:hypothetical protein